MTAMITCDGRWRVEVGGIGSFVVWYHLPGPSVDQWIPSVSALVTELQRRTVNLADLGCGAAAA